MSSSIRCLLGLAASLSLLGCEADPLPLIDGEFSAILVYGDVRTAAGAPVPGSTVSVWDSRAADCSTDSPADQATTDAAGGFRAIPGNWGTGYDACIVVRAQPPAAAGLQGRTVTRHPVRLSPDLDSVRIDVVLED